MTETLSNYKLPAKIYRRLLLVTSAWAGERVAPDSLLVRCHQVGGRPPLFWSGTPDVLANFQAALGKERSLYCLCSTYAVLEPTKDNIQALARYYLAEIIKVQPQGPYVLGGYCEASLITYEIAKLMQASGLEVGMLFLFDRDVTEADLWLRLARRLFITYDRVLFRSVQIRENPVQCIQEILINKWQQLVESPWQLVKQKLIKSEPIHVNEDDSYQLMPYPGKIHLVYVRFGLLGFFQFSFFRRYWRRLALGGLKCHIIPGKNHLNPNWSMVAQLLQGFMREVGV